MDSDSRRGFDFLPFLIVVLFLAGALWVVLAARRNRKPVGVPQGKTPVRPKTKSIILPETMPSGALPPPDDLTKIDGIGPKVAAVLRANGILSFSQLANTKTEKLKSILVDSGNRISDPTTWPEQAKLAAIGSLDQLKQLQSFLKARRQPK